MKWFGVDADTPSAPAIRWVIRRLGNEGLGELFRIWCFVAQHGSQPGLAQFDNGQPFVDQDFIEAADTTLERWQVLRDTCLETNHFDRELYSKGVVFIPAMAKRGDEYSKKQARKQKKEGKGDQPALIDVRTVSGQSPPIRTQQNKTQQNTPEEEEQCTPAQAIEFFESRFWPAYPNRVSKVDAEKAMSKLRPGRALQELIIAAIEKQKAGSAWTDQGGKYIPHPATWLNGRRWRDEVKANVLPMPPRPGSGATGAAPAGKYAGLMKRDAK